MPDTKRSRHALLVDYSLRDFSTLDHVFVSLARVEDWRQERSAFAARHAPSGVRQGDPWGSTT